MFHEAPPFGASPLWSEFSFPNPSMTPTAAKPSRLRQFIAGQWQPSASDDWVPDLNPSNKSDVIAEVPRGAPEDVDKAVAAAAKAFEAWRNLTGPARAELLYNWGTAIGARQEELAQAVTREVGKPISESRAEVGRCVTILRYFAG